MADEDYDEYYEEGSDGDRPGKAQGSHQDRLRRSGSRDASPSCERSRPLGSSKEKDEKEQEPPSPSVKDAPRAEAHQSREEDARKGKRRRIEFPAELQPPDRSRSERLDGQGSGDPLDDVSAADSKERDLRGAGGRRSLEREPRGGGAAPRRRTHTARSRSPARSTGGTAARPPQSRHRLVACKERRDAVYSVQTGLLWPLDRSTEAHLEGFWRARDRVWLVFGERRSDFVLGYGELKSGPVRNAPDASPFPDAKRSVFRVHWHYFGEYNKRLFSDLERNLHDSRELPEAVGKEMLERMDAEAARNNLPPPVTVAAAMQPSLRIAPLPSRLLSKAAAAVVAAVPDGGAQKGVATGGAGFLRRGRDSPALDAPRRVSVPPGGDAPPAAPAAAKGGRPNGVTPPAAPPRSDPLSRKHILDLSYEEYLEVFGRVEEAWRQRQMEEARLLGQRAVIGEDAYVARCRQMGFTHPELQIRQEYRKRMAEAGLLRFGQLTAGAV